MTVNVLGFGIAREIFERSSVALDLNKDHTVAGLKAVLEGKYPGLQKLKTYLIAVNNEFAEDQTVVGAEDEIAVIPPVSGG